MEIIRKSCANGAKGADGLVVIIDVFRAFSCEPLFFHFGVKRVILEAIPDKAIALKLKNPEFILIGEKNEVPLEKADLGNSPSHIILKGKPYFMNKTVIHRTTAGVTGAVAAHKSADEVLLGSFVNAKATAKYIMSKNPEKVTLVAMGERAKTKSPEDEACGDYIEHLLTGKGYDPAKAFKEIVFRHTTQKFVQGEKPYLPKEDPVFCLQRDLFDFALRVKKIKKRLEVFKTRLFVS